MYANDAAAIRASVLLALTCQKLVHALSSQFFEVFYHTHSVAFAVPPVYAIKVLAGHLIAFKAVLHFVFCKFLAFSLDETVFASRETACAVEHFASLTWNPVGVG